MDPSKIPFFPKWCHAPLVDADECTLLGMTIPCMNAFGEQEMNYFGFEMLTSHIWTFILTTTIGLYNLSLVRSASPEPKEGVVYCRSFSNNGQTMTITTGLYAIITGIFAVVRYYWGVSKPLLLTAALHNLCEWLIVVMIAENSKSRLDLRRGFMKSFYWISFIICFGMIIPDLFWSFALEQSFGIILDMLLPILLIGKAFFSDDENKSFYWLAAVAHTVHLFGTIIPLIFAIFFMNNPSIFSDLYLEALINLTVPLTHGLYCLWR